MPDNRRPVGASEVSVQEILDQILLQANRSRLGESQIGPSGEFTPQGGQPGLPGGQQDPEGDGPVNFGSRGEMANADSWQGRSTPAELLSRPSPQGQAAGLGQPQQAASLPDGFEPAPAAPGMASHANARAPVNGTRGAPGLSAPPPGVASQRALDDMSGGVSQQPASQGSPYEGMIGEDEMAQGGAPTRPFEGGSRAPSISVEEAIRELQILEARQATRGGLAYYPEEEARRRELQRIISGGY